MSTTQKTLGHMFALFTIVVWGSCYVLTKNLLAAGYTAIQIIPLRMALAYVALLVMRPKFLRLPLKDELMFVLIGITGGSFYFFLQNTALTYTYAAKGSDEFVAETPTNAGEYTVKATIAETANYNAAEATADFTINKALLTVTVKNQTVNYGSPAAQGKYTVKGLVDGDTVDVKLYTKIATNEVKATVKASANYKVKVVSGILTIKGAPIAKAQPSGSNMLVSYTKVQKADGYDIFAGYCGSGSYPLAKTIKGNSVTATKLTKIGGKAINTKKNVFLYVVAYKMVNGKKVTLVRSASLHIAGANTKYTNAKSIKVAKTSLTLKKGKTTTLKPTMTLVSSGKKLISCTDKFRYASCNKSIAKVDASGKITAVGKGTVNLYVYATNGVKTKVVVTVK